LSVKQSFGPNLPLMDTKVILQYKEAAITSQNTAKSQMKARQNWQQIWGFPDSNISFKI